MRNPDFIASPQNVEGGENIHGFRAVTAAGNVRCNPLPRQDVHTGPNMNGDRWAQFPEGADYTMSARGVSKRLGKGR